MRRADTFHGSQPCVGEATIRGTVAGNMSNHFSPPSHDGANLSSVAKLASKLKSKVRSACPCRCEKITDGGWSTPVVALYCPKPHSMQSDSGAGVHNTASLDTFEAFDAFDALDMGGREDMDVFNACVAASSPSTCQFFTENLPAGHDEHSAAPAADPSPVSQE